MVGVYVLMVARRSSGRRSEPKSLKAGHHPTPQYLSYEGANLCLTFRIPIPNAMKVVFAPRLHAIIFGRLSRATRAWRLVSIRLEMPSTSLSTMSAASHNRLWGDNSKVRLNPRTPMEASECLSQRLQRMPKARKGRQAKSPRLFLFEEVSRLSEASFFIYKRTKSC